MVAPLKYRFVAEYQTGAPYVQPLDDVSVQEPGKSAWYDIRHHPIRPESGLIRFSLLAVEPGRLITVDLRDGHFEINGVAFRMTEGRVEGCRLWFSRRHRTTFGAGVEPTDYVTYRIGWQAGDQQQILEIE
jgi:hypothetical protein